MTVRIACIGSRDLTTAQLGLCEKLGEWVVRCGHILDTGNAPGADQAFARGANQVRPDLVRLHLPWYNFERQAIHDDNAVYTVDALSEEQLLLHTQNAEKFHPAWGRLSQGARKLMVRNGMIMMPLPLCFHVDMCLALPSNKQGRGGTGQGMRIAEHFGVKLVDLRERYDHHQLFLLCEEIAGLAEVAK